MKAILISIKPKWVAKILNGEKTIEIRKSCPQVFKNLKPYECCSIDVYIYCSKDKQNLLHKNCADIYWVEDIEFKTKNKKLGLKTQPYLNGKVVAKFTLNKVEEITNRYYKGMLIDSCLTNYELNNYLGNCIGYAWHISNLVIFDTPKELSEFRKLNTPSYEQTKPFAEIFGKPYTQEEYKTQCERFGFTLTKAPQSWQFIEVE